jgi:hypothetical protein
MGVESYRQPDAAKLVACASFSNRKSEALTGFLLLLTNVETALQLLPNRHKLHSRPKIWAQRLGHSKSPASTIYVTSIFPDRLKPLLKKIYRLSHLNVFDRGVVVVPPEVLHALNLGA